MRSIRYDIILRGVDDIVRKEKSPQARRQMKKRVLGVASTRPKPSSKDIPTWALATV
jgi:hypothetical protein